MRGGQGQDKVHPWVGVLSGPWGQSLVVAEEKGRVPQGFPLPLPPEALCAPVWEALALVNKGGHLPIPWYPFSLPLQFSKGMLLLPGGLMQMEGTSLEVTGWK